MNLLELIVSKVKRENINHDAKYFAQDSGGTNPNGIYCHERKPSPRGLFWIGIGEGIAKDIPLSEDSVTTIITREELMRAYDLVEQGYTLWFGGECPVNDNEIISIQMRGGNFLLSVTNEYLDWSIDDCDDDIIAYKVVEIENTQIEVAKGEVTIFDAESLMRDISKSMPEMMAADMVELADYLIAQGWGKHE